MEDINFRVTISRKNFYKPVPIKRKFPRQLSIYCYISLIKRKQIEKLSQKFPLFRNNNKNQTLIIFGIINDCIFNIGQWIRQRKVSRPG